MKNIHKLNGFIYVTSEEKPSIKDWSINLNCKYAHQELCSIDNEIELKSYVNSYENDCKKIIITNDPKLTTVQQLTPEEEAYCKTVDSVEVVKGRCRLNDDGEEIGFPDMSLYKLQLPKQETIEEVAYNYAEVYRCPATNKDEYCKHDIISAINFGYNHAVKTLYTEEEVFLIIEKFRDLKMIAFSEWFNQNKKK